MAASSASAAGTNGMDHTVVMDILSARSHFEVLGKGLHKQSSDDEIKKAYRVMALKSHPDKNKHERAEEAFKRVHSAFQALETQEKRDMYHRRHGGVGFAQANASGNSDDDPFGGNGFGSHDSAFGFFEMFMGMGMGGGFGARGGHMHVTMDDLVRLMMFREMMRGSFGGFGGGGGGIHFSGGDFSPFDDEDEDEGYDEYERGYGYDYEDEEEEYYDDQYDENDFDPDDLDYHTIKPGKPGYYICVACQKKDIKDTGFELLWHQRDEIHVQNLRNYRMYGGDDDVDEEDDEEEEDDEDDDLEIETIRQNARGEYFCDACQMILGTSDLSRVAHEEGFTHLMNVGKMSRFAQTVKREREKDDEDDDENDMEEEDEEGSAHNDLDNEFIERRKVTSSKDNNEDVRFDHQVRSHAFHKGMTFNIRSRMYVCRTCNVTVKEESDMATHLTSKRHHEEVKLAQSEENDDYFCRLCDSLCHGRRQIQEHVNGKRHQKAIKSANVKAQSSPAAQAPPAQTKSRAKPMKRG